MLARGLATAFPALNVLEVRGTALFSPLVGEAEAALRDVVKRVRPCNCVYLPRVPQKETAGSTALCIGTGVCLLSTTLTQCVLQR